MGLTTSVQGTDSVVAISGRVHDSDVSDLRAGVLDVLDRNRGDLLLDMRAAGPVDDALLIPALVAVRTPAKYLHHRIVVIDDADGKTASSLRRLGMHFRFAVYPDADSASAGPADDRATRDRLTLSGPA